MISNKFNATTGLQPPQVCGLIWPTLNEFLEVLPRILTRGLALIARREQEKTQATTENDELRKKCKQLMKECEETAENRLQLVGMATCSV